MEEPVEPVIEEEEEHPVNFDPYTGPILSIQDAFNKSIQSMRVPIDKVKILNDNCESLAEAISTGTARIVSNGSFDPESKQGTTALFMTSGKSKLNLLKAATWTPGHEEDQSA